MGKKIHVRNLHQRNQQTFTKFTWETSTGEINKLSRNSREKPPPEKSTNFHEIQRNFHDSENDNNEENELIVKDTNIENNNDEDNRLRINGGNIENGIN